MADSERTTHDSEFGSVLGSYANIEELVRRIRERDKDAEQLLWDRYVRRLIGLVRSKLDPKFRTRFSAESVVQSAMAGFFVQMRKGEFVLDNCGQLWHLLAAIAMNKLRQKARWHSQIKRDIDKDQPAIAGLDGSVHGIPLAELVAEPHDEEVRELRDGVEVVLATRTPLERFIITLSLQGYSTKEVKEKAAASSESHVRKVLRDFKDDLEDRLKSNFAASRGEAK